MTHLPGTYSRYSGISPEQAAARRDVAISLAAASANIEVVRYTPGSRVWPDCPGCKQSPTGVYAGKVSCVRCCSDRRING